MRYRRLSIRLALVLAAAVVFAAPMLAQTYGLNDQVLTVGSSEFHPIASGQAFEFGSDGYLSGEGVYFAPLRLPDGAEITQMCFYIDDTDSSENDAFLTAMKLPAGGQSGGAIPIPGSTIVASFNIGYGTVCTNPMSFTILSDADLDGQGSEHLAYFVEALLTSASSSFGGVRITWHRQVSAAPATATFADVPVGAFGFQQIEALAASGITGGCGGGNYCPDQSLTRAQMAIFLAKALGLYWGN